MVKKVFAFTFVGITTAASITGVVLTNTSISELKAVDNSLTMTFTSDNVSSSSTSGYYPYFTLSTTTQLTETPYSATGTLSIEGNGYVQFKKNGHIFHILDGEDVELSMPFEFHNITRATSVTISGKNVGYTYTKTFIPSNNDLVINVSLPDLDYERDGTTEVYIDTITVSYVC